MQLALLYKVFKRYLIKQDHLILQVYSWKLPVYDVIVTGLDGGNMEASYITQDEVHF